MSLSTEYTAAIAAHDEAAQFFRAAQAAYRARKTNDAEFLAAKAAFDAATAVFDAAYDAEAARREREEHAEAVAQVSQQLNLFAE